LRVCRALLRKALHWQTPKRIRADTEANLKSRYALLHKAGTWQPNVGCHRTSRQNRNEKVSKSRTFRKHRSPNWQTPKRYRLDKSMNIKGESLSIAHRILMHARQTPKTIYIHYNDVTI
jgi:hypothetical protein